jgi:uncharacterized protein with HEPN domain
MPRTIEQRLLDIKEAATDLRDFAADVGTTAFHALPHANRLGHRAIKNALTEIGEATKAMPDEIRLRRSDVGLEGLLRPQGRHRPELLRHRYT